MQSLPELLTALYDYHVQLGGHFRRDVEAAAKQAAIGSGHPIKLIPTSEPICRKRNGKPLIRYGKPVYLLSWDADERFRIAYGEAERIIRGRRQKAGKPHEHSRAWQYAVRWVSRKLPVATGELLKEYCSLLSRENRALAVGDKGVRHFEEGMTSEIWTRRDEPNSDRRLLAEGIDGLSIGGAGEELLLEVWKRYEDEAKDARLTRSRTPYTSDTLSGAIAQVQPLWIENIAHAVHRHTQVAEYTLQYRKMITAYLQRISPGWKSAGLRKSLRQQYPTWTDKEIEAELAKLRLIGEDARVATERRAQGTGITTDAAVPLDQEYATLAAIHEKFCPCHGFGLEFWHPSPGGWKNPHQAGATDADSDHVTEAFFFQALKLDAESLTDADRPGVERMLDEVASNLKRHSERNHLVGCAVDVLPRNLVDFLLFLRRQYFDERSDYSARLHRLRAESPDAHSELAGRNPDRVRITPDGIPVPHPYRYACRWVEKRIADTLCEAEREHGGAVDGCEVDLTSFWEGSASGESSPPAINGALERAITADDPVPDTPDGRVMAAVMQFDVDGRTDGLLSIMRRYYPEEAKQRNWPPPNDRSDRPTSREAAGPTMDGTRSAGDAAPGTASAPRADAGKRRKGTASQINKEGRKDLVVNYCRDNQWDGTLAELAQALLRDRRLNNNGKALSESTLWRYLEGTSFVRKGKPSRAAKGTSRVAISREPDPSSYEQSEFYTMPDDPEPIS